ncbi:MAG: hypothetical protein CM15mV65_240 [Caudoviricetes sp.]|nr:MAG: hypothetical protein CM15mV65_240 [Caudoviricetes sp.]
MKEQNLWIALHEINGAMKILEQQILETQADTRIKPAIRYRGINPTRSNSTIRVSGATILLRTSLTMFQKIANILSIVSFVMVASMSGGAYFGYKYVTSEQFKSQVMNEVLGNVQT